jgi:hypothetical protein
MVMERDDLTKREVPHLRETPVRLAILLQDPLGGLLKVGRRVSDKVADDRGGQLLNRHVQALRGLSETSLSIIGKLD